ncbi:MAG TPA: DNA alkylation repair protein [Gammaproteobacteria bacterium]|nr:DNA alkylation repair protein [Gammaproteobacteria bacterium]
MTLVAALRRALDEHADPAIAAGQAAYMQNIQPFRGVKTPERRALLRACLAAHPVTDYESYRAGVRELWRGKFREERYLALDLAARLKPFRRDALPLFEEMLAETDWWDVLDPLATDLLGGALRGQPAMLAARVRTWRDDDHLWTRRAALLVQLKYRQDTDRELLAETILQLAPEKEFFIRKAIGWALREYAKTEPRWVKAFVAEHENELSALSRREALKHVDGRAQRMPRASRTSS